MRAEILLNGKTVSSKLFSATVKEVIHTICKETGLKQDEFYLVENGKKIEGDHEIIGNAHAIIRHLGGKGGFGSMLRAIGAQIEKTTNREACRDLSGRRLRDINEEKRLKAWLDKQKDRETEAEEKRKKKLEKLMAVPKHEFKDAEYESARSELAEKISASVEEGFKKSTATISGVKRKATENGQPKKKRAALWIGDDISSSSDTDTDDSDSENDSNSKASSSKASSSKEDFDQHKDTDKSADDSSNDKIPTKEVECSTTLAEK